MSLFGELNKYINDVLWRLVQNQNLCKLLYYDTDGNVDPLSMPDLSEEQRLKLLFKHIYPYPKLPTDENANAGSYITVMFDNIEKGGSIYFKDSLLTFNVFCHLNLWRIPDKLRPLEIMDQIETIFNNKTTIGIGTTQYHRGRSFVINKDFAGYTITYKFIDFSG